MVVLATTLLAAALQLPAQAQPQTRFAVFFGRLAEGDQPAAECGTVRAVPRSVPYTPRVAAESLNALFAGPTEAERAAGWRSPFSSATAGLLRSVRIVRATAYVDLADLRETLAGAGSSCGAAELQVAIERTLRQFPAVQRVIVAIDGDPRRFYDWQGMPCNAANDHCNAQPFRATLAPR
jgi:spore germination protein GerM